LHFRNTEGTDVGTETDINLFHGLYYHFLGTDQSEDILCWRDSEHELWLSSARISDDGQVGFGFGKFTSMVYIIVVDFLNEFRDLFVGLP